MTYKKSLLALLVTASVTGLAACGGSSGGGDDPAPTPAPETNDPYLVSDWYNAGANNRSDIDPALDSAGRPTASSPTLKGATYAFTASSPDLQDAAYSISLGAPFADVDYIGAFPQDTQDNWTDGWTVDLNGNATVWAPATGGTLAGATPSANGSCPTGTTDIGDQALSTGGSMDICQLAQRYDTDGDTLTLTNDNIYRLATGFPGTYIGDGDAADGDSSNDVNVTLSIEPGTLIVGDVQEALIITRGSQVNAAGTAADPIVMTSKTQVDAWMAGGDGTSGRGEWAGFALMGYAQTNECGTPCDVAAEGNIGYYGGTVDTDNSGTVQYVVVRHAGNDIDGNGNELNGFTLFGVGSGTTIDHVQVHMGYDDGIEHFGSTDFMSHIVLTGNRDDSFDWGQGYTGGAQFVVIKQAADAADRGIEADNDGDAPDAVPVSKPTLANFTFIGQPGGDQSADGILLRRGTGAMLYNFVVTGFGDACIDIDDSATADEATAGNLEINNSVVYCATGENFESGDGDGIDVAAWFAAGDNNRTVNPNLQSNGMPNPVSGSGDNFVTTDYIGAFDPDGSNWTDGWTVDLNGNATVWAPATGGTLAGAVPTADDSCPTGTTDIGNQAILSTLGGGSMDICQLAQRYDTDGDTLTLTNDNIYRLASGFPGTYIGDGDAADGDSSNDVNVTLSIEPGTLIVGDVQEALIITRGSQVNAAGTAADPIVMTSKTQVDAWMAGGDGTSGRGEWAGFALMGYAQTNECGTPCDVAAEGNIGYYGGTVDTDNSGTVQYVVVRHAGNDIDGNGNELNGFTLFGVGSGTTIDHVQVHMGYDDGIEHFGSTDFMSHIVLTGNGDDSFDWGQGYRGGVQFMVVKQASDQADRGIEADNDGDAPDATPISMPTLANITLMGDANGDASADGILLRRGTGAKIWNAIVTGFADVCIDLDDDATFDRAGPNAPGVLTGDLVMNNSLVSCTTNFDEE